MQPDGVIFDFDGVLCNSDTVHKDAFMLSLKSSGYSWCNSKEQTYERIKNEKTSFKLKTFVELQLIRLEDVEKLNSIKQDLTQNLITSLSMDKRVVQAIQSLKRRFLKTGIASNASKQSIISYLKANSTLELFDVIVSSDDVSKKTKPLPDVYTKALSSLNLNATDSIAFEDSEQGFIAAKMAGIDRVYLCDYTNLFEVLEKACNLKQDRIII
jgi:putative hydrolase of the HAD superfamily